MPRYDFRCRKGHVEEFVLPMDRRDAPLSQRCRVCHGELSRIFAAPSVPQHTAEQTFYEYERDAWGLATGQKHENAKDLSDWCQANGKTIVGKGYRPTKPEPCGDQEALNALQEIYDRNHNLGEIG